MSGEPCFLDAKEWKTIPEGLIDFPLLPKPPELHHAFFSHIAAVPGLMSQVKLHTSDINRSRHIPILLYASKLRLDLKSWHNQYITSENGLRRPVLTAAVSASERTYPFDSIYIYNDVLSASIITTYYAYLIVINREMNRLHADVSYFQENSELAKAICLSVNYCSHAGYCGAQTLIFSLPIAITALSGKFRSWAEAWLERCSGNMQAPMIQTSQS
jgi:hypothetical protein